MLFRYKKGSIKADSSLRDVSNQTDYFLFAGGSGEGTSINETELAEGASLLFHTKACSEVFPFQFYIIIPFTLNDIFAAGKSDRAANPMCFPIGITAF